MSKGDRKTDFDVFDLTISSLKALAPAAPASRANREIVWETGEFRVAATDGGSRTLICPREHPQVLTGGFRIFRARERFRAHVNRPVRGTRPQPDGWEVGVAPDGLAGGGSRDLRFSIDIVCSR